MEGHTSSILSGFTAMVETEKYSCGGSKARLAMSISPLLAGHMMNNIAIKRTSCRLSLSGIGSLFFLLKFVVYYEVNYGVGCKT